MITILSHQPDAGPGNLTTWLDGPHRHHGRTARSLTPSERTRRSPGYRVVDVPDEGVPDEAGSALVVLGSRETATDPAVPWADPERRLIARCVDAGTPVLGICFGAQQLALVLGGTVDRLAEPEFGWIRVGGRNWFAWHQDHIGLPPGAVEISRNDRCLQAFRHGPHLGVQFHPETTETRIADWIDQAARMDRLVAAGGSVEALRARTTRYAPAAQRAAADLYSDFFPSP